MAAKNPKKQKSNSEEQQAPPIARRIACRCLISCGYHLAVLPLATFMAEVKRNRDPREVFDPKAWSRHKKEIRSIIKEARQLINGKRQVHRILVGSEEDACLLNDLEKSVDKLEEEVAIPLDDNKIKANSKLRASKYKKVFDAAVPIYRPLRKNSNIAFERLKEALSEKGINGSTTTVTHPLVSVVSIDMQAYTDKARQLQDGMRNPDPVFELNKQIIALFHDALAKAGVDVNRTCIQGTGDGALIYVIGNPDLAVKFALCVRDDAMWSNLGIQLAEWKRVLRIGIATGPIKMEITADSDGGIVSFFAAGVAIIEAVRLQSVCAPTGICISEPTCLAMTDSRLQSAFPTIKEIEVKGWKIQSRPYVGP